MKRERSDETVHMQDDVNLHILRMFDDTFLLDAALLRLNSDSLLSLWFKLYSRHSIRKGPLYTYQWLHCEIINLKHSQG